MWYDLVDSLRNSVNDEAACSNDLSCSMDCSTVLRVETIHISSPILAAKSPFFYKVKDSGLMIAGLCFLGIVPSHSFVCFMPPIVVFQWDERVGETTSNS